MSIENNSNMFKILWEKLDINNDGFINNQDKSDIEAKKNDNISIYTKFEEAFGDLNISKNDYNDACEEAYNIDDVIANLKKKNSAIKTKSTMGLVAAEEDVIQENAKQEINGNIIKRDSEGRIVYKRNKDGDETIIIYNEDGSTEETIKYADGAHSIKKKDSEGRITYFNDGYGNEQTIQYGKDGSVDETIKYADGTYTRTKKNSKGRVMYTEELSSNGKKLISKYNENGKLEERIQYYGKYEIRSFKKNGEYFINIKNTESGEVQSYTFDKVEASEAGKEYLFEMLSKAPGDVLKDLISENPKICIKDGFSKRSYVNIDDKDGEYIVLYTDENRDCAIPHELGHIIDHKYNGTKDDGFSSNNEEFLNAFAIGLSRYETDGHKKYDENDPFNGDYCTGNPEEMFAECYCYITTGETAGTNIEVLQKYFPECLEFVKQHLGNARNDNSGN